MLVLQTINLVILNLTISCHQSSVSEWAKLFNLLSKLVMQVYT